MQRTMTRAATFAELVALLLCVAGLVFGGPHLAAESKVARSAGTAEDVAAESESEKENEDDLGALPPAGRRQAAESASSGFTPSAPDSGKRFGPGALAPGGRPFGIARPSHRPVQAPQERPRPCLAEIFLAPVRPRGPTLPA